MRRHTLILLPLLGVALVGSLVLLRAHSAHASRILMKDGDLYSVSDVLGEKRLTNNKNIHMLFDRKLGKLLFGKGLEGAHPDTEFGGGTHLFQMNEDGTDETPVTSDLVSQSFIDSASRRIFYTTVNADLYVMNIDGTGKRKLQEKVLSPNLSPDGQSLVYQKLNADWQSGNYYDRALGLTALNIATGREQRLSDKWEDFNPVWTPDGKKILFFSASPEGLASHFIMHADGSGRTQLTNIGQKFVSDATVDNPSEAPQWSQDGKYFVYEADHKIWINIFDNKHERILSAKPIAYGSNPQWLEDGKSLSVVVTPQNSTHPSLIDIDVNGQIVH